MARAKPRWDGVDLHEAAAGCRSWRSLMMALGYSSGTGRAFTALQTAVAEAGVDVSHFTGQRWGAGSGKGRDKEKQRAAWRRWASRNPDTVRRLARGQRAAIVDLVTQMKRGPCMDCGNTFPTVAMDFDHRDGTVKLFNIGHGAKRVASRQTILAEIAKCDLVCAVCHRIRTARRAGWKIQ